VVRLAPLLSRVPIERFAAATEDVSEAMKTGKRRGVALIQRCHRRMKALARIRIELAQSGRFSASGKRSFTSALTRG
jgi:hypothetical protein